MTAYFVRRDDGAWAAVPAITWLQVVTAMRLEPAIMDGVAIAAVDAGRTAYVAPKCCGEYMARGDDGSFYCYGCGCYRWVL